jgi:hypothetical protein
MLYINLMALSCWVGLVVMSNTKMVDIRFVALVLLSYRLDTVTICAFVISLD